MPAEVRLRQVVRWAQIALVPAGRDLGDNRDSRVIRACARWRTMASMCPNRLMSPEHASSSGSGGSHQWISPSDRRFVTKL